jgi:hypothetical protein
LKAFSGIIALISVLFAIKIVGSYYKDHKAIHYKYMLITWVFMFIEILFYVFSWLFDNNVIFIQIGNTFAPLMVIAFFFLIESISHDHFDSKKLLIYLILIMGFFASGNRLYMYVSMIYISTIWVYYHGKMFYIAPTRMKINAKIAFIGSIIMAIGNMYFLFYLGDFNYLVIGIGVCVVSMAYQKEPNLPYLLPNKVYRISIIHLTNGIPLFSYDWDPNHPQIDDSLFTGMLTAIGMLVKEVVDKGNLRELVLDNAALIIHRSSDFPVAYILVCQKPTKVLRTSLNYFAQTFETEFKDQLIDVQEVTRFRKTQEIINRCFSFIQFN